MTSIRPTRVSNNPYQHTLRLWIRNLPSEIPRYFETDFELSLERSCNWNLNELIHHIETQSAWTDGLHIICGALDVRLFPESEEETDPDDEDKNLSEADTVLIGGSITEKLYWAWERNLKPTLIVTIRSEACD